MKKATILFILLLAMKLTTAQTTVSITVKESSDYTTPVSGASVTLDSTTVITGSDGLATFNIATPLEDVYHSYTVSAPGFIDYHDDYLYIEANATIVDYSAYIDRAFSASFTIVDKNKNAIAGAKIDIGNLQIITDSNGKASFNKKLASSWQAYNFKISADGFADFDSSFTISNADLDVDTIILNLAYNIKLTIKNGTNDVLENAIVSIDNEKLNSDSDGIIIFSKKINAVYNYQIYRSGFIDKSGTIRVQDKDTAADIILSEGYDLKLIVINGNKGTIGLANDTITFNGITKFTNEEGIAVFGVAPGSINFTNKKAGFIDSPVSIEITDKSDSAIIYMKPSYNVFFTLYDEFSYLPLQGISVNLNGHIGFTDEFGMVSFLNLEPSDTDYTYTATSDAGYNVSSGTLPLPNSSPYADQFNIINQTLTMNKPGITISLGQGMMQYYAPTTINLAGVDYEYNTGLGTVRIEIAPGTYPIIITPEDITKAIIKDSVTVGNTGNDYQFFYVEDGYKVEIYAADKQNNPIIGASVVFGRDTAITDDSGDAIYLRKAPGDYSYSISMDGFKKILSANLSVVTSDVLEIATMDRLGYHATFHVTDGINALESANVEFNSTNQLTDAGGTTSFEGLSAGSYNYNVSLNGFLIAQGMIEIVDADILKEVILVADVVQMYLHHALNLYPNPAANKLNFSTGDWVNKNIRISIIDLSGKVMKTEKIENAGTLIEMDIDELAPGSYFVKIQCEAGKQLIKLMKN